MLDLKKIKVYGKDEEKTLDLSKLNTNNPTNTTGDPIADKLNELRGLVEDIKNKNKKYKKEYLVNKLNEIIKTYWSNEDYF